MTAEHYVLTRSVYGPDWSRAANLRRLALTRAVTVPLMAAQTTHDWTWLVALDPRDGLIEQRLAVYREAGVDVRPIMWAPAAIGPAPWDRNGHRTTHVQQVAATAYRAPWRAEMQTARRVLMTRLDDDDGLALDALERFALAALEVPPTKRRILVLPEGFRVSHGRYVRVWHPANAMHSLVTPAGDDLCIYDYGHAQIARGGHLDLPKGAMAPLPVANLEAPAPVSFVDERAGWMWIRHPDAISGDPGAARPISEGLRRMFPIDWSVLA